MKLCHIVSWWKGRRIVEKDGKFYASFRRKGTCTWYNIDRTGSDYWFEYQERCACDTYKEVIETFVKYQAYLDEIARRNKITIHCVE